MITPKKFSSEEVALSKRMITAWTQFAATGHPGWEQYNTESRTIKVFDKVDSEFSGNDEHWQARCKFVQELIENK